MPLNWGVSKSLTTSRQMKKVQDVLVKQKEYVVAYNSETMSDLLASGEAVMTNHWSGFSRLGRLTGAPIVYAYPKEGVVGWYDSMVVPTSAKNVDNAKKFMNFMMDPVNMAMLTENQGYGDAVKGTEAYYSRLFRILCQRKNTRSIRSQIECSIKPAFKEDGQLR